MHFVRFEPSPRKCPARVHLLVSTKYIMHYHNIMDRVDACTLTHVRVHTHIRTPSASRDGTGARPWGVVLGRGGR